MAGSVVRAALPASDAPSGAWDARPTLTLSATVSVTALCIATAAGVLAPDATATAGPALLVAAGLLGLPHGAADHLALGWADGRGEPVRPVVLLTYAAAALLAVAVTLIVPLPALALLLVVSVAHFAEGEAAFDRLRGGAALALPATGLATAVVVLPLVLRPADTLALLGALDPGLPVLLDRARLSLLVMTALLVATGLAAALRAGQRRPAAELAVVTVAAVLVPPLVVFAVWFGGWHAPRHLVRLMALQPDGDRRTRALRLVRGAALPSVVAAAGLTALTALTGGLPAAVLVTLLALTVPHTAVVARLDRWKHPKR